MKRGGFILGLALSLAACEGEPVAVVASAELTDSVAHSGRSGRFPSAIVERTDAIPVFLSLVRSHHDPRVVAAGLDALAYHAWQLESPINASALGELAAERLVHPEGLVRSAAYLLLENLLTRQRLRDAPAQLVARVRSEATVADRVRAIEVVSRSDWWTDTRMSAAMLEAAQEEHPLVAAVALQRLVWSEADVAVQRSWWSLILPQLDHPSAVVRGRALRALVAMDAQDPWIWAAVRHAMNDHHPFVRSTAASLFETTHDPRALARVVELARDDTPDSVVLDGWTTLRGKPGSRRLFASVEGRVQASAIQSLRSVTRDVEASRWSVPDASGVPVTAGLATAGEAATVWYAAHGEAMHAFLESRR